jgi:RNA polymerase sigma-70 factor (ECF subfamily)
VDATRPQRPTLLQRVAAGEAAAMQECIDEYGGLVWALARRASISATEAEEGVQEVFIALWQNAARYEPARGDEVTFVAMVARRRLIDRGRSRKRRERALSAIEPVATAATERAADAAPADEVIRAARAMEQLSPPQREVLQLAIHQGYTHQEIARLTNMPLGTVKTHARRGLMRVREMLEGTHAAGSSPP